MNAADAPLPGDALDDDLVELVDTLLSTPAAPARLRDGPLRQRLFDRVARSAAAARRMVTVRRGEPGQSPAPGVHIRTLYTATAGRAPRPGEPQRVLSIELEPGARWAVDGGTPGGLRREWLVIRGRARVGGSELGTFDYHVVPAGAVGAEVASMQGAVLYLREAAASPGDAASQRAQTAVDDAAAWADFAPGVQRRVLWSAGGEAALLYRAAAGASVPRHGHGHDEECLMIEGELFADEVLLRAGEYQLAPAGTEHGGLHTDVGGVIYAHGDLDLAVISG